MVNDKYIGISEYIRIVENFKGGTIIDASNNHLKSYEINPSGLEVILLCNGSRTKYQIIEELKLKYAISDPELITLIAGFIDEHLHLHNLIEKVKKEEKAIFTWGSSRIVTPFYFSFELTNHCQFQCQHCFNSSGIPKGDEIGIEKFISIADELIHLGAQGAFVTGGEPLLKVGINDLLIFLLKNISSVTLATNAYGLTEETLQVIQEAKNITVQVSIDGMEENHEKIRLIKGSFKKTVDNIKRLTSRGVSVVTAFTMNDGNYIDLEKVILLSEKIGCVGVNIGLTSSEGRAKENDISTGISREFISIVQELNKKYTTDEFIVGMDINEGKIKEMADDIEYQNKCGAGYRGIHIMPNGDVTMCPATPKIRMGNVNEQSLKEILVFNNIEPLMNIPSPTREKCGDCELYGSCGNCLANVLEKSVEECAIQRELQKIS